jgi:hypothetical protein
MSLVWELRKKPCSNRVVIELEREFGDLSQFGERLGLLDNNTEDLAD